METDHRPPCDGSCSSSSWICGICKRVCAPCWGGGVDDELGDLCDPCLTILRKEPPYMIEEVESLNRITAAIAAARANPGWEVVAVSYERGDSPFYVALAKEEELYAANGARQHCREHGHHPGYFGHEQVERCLRCGIILNAPNSGAAKP